MTLKFFIGPIDSRCHHDLEWVSYGFIKLHLFLPKEKVRAWKYTYLE